MVTWWPLHFCREYTGDLTFWLSQLNYTNHSVCVYYMVLHCFDRSCIIVSPPPHCLTTAALCYRRCTVSPPLLCLTPAPLSHHRLSIFPPLPGLAPPALFLPPRRIFSRLVTSLTTA